MKRALKLLCAVLAAISLITGCAGSGKNVQPNAAREWVKLPETVPESFSFQITDKQMREMILNIKTEALGPANRLEIKLLQELAAIEHPDAMGSAFDRTWDMDEALQRIVEQDAPSSAFTPALALSYFMLTYDDTYNWRDKTGKKIYNRSLQNIKPEMLNGYSLHFYTLALLKNGYFDCALPFLRQLKKKTTPSIYREDLTIALDYSIIKKDTKFAGKIIQHMLSLCRQNELNLPDEQIAAALVKLKRSSNLAPVAKILSTELSDSRKLESYAFYDHIAHYKKTEPPPSEKQPPEKPVAETSKTKKTVKPQKAPATNKASEPETTKIELREDAVRIRVQIISADNKAEYVDPDLGEIGHQLNDSLQASQIYLEEEAKFLLIPGQQEKVEIDHNHNVIVLLKSISAENARINVTVFKGSDKIYDTLIESVDKGETIIGGPAIEETQLILRLTTWLEI